LIVIPHLRRLLNCPFPPLIRSSFRPPWGCERGLVWGLVLLSCHTNFLGLSVRFFTRDGILPLVKGITTFLDPFLPIPLNTANPPLFPLLSTTPVHPLTFPRAFSLLFFNPPYNQKETALLFIETRFFLRYVFFAGLPFFPLSSPFSLARSGAISWFFPPPSFVKVLHRMNVPCGWSGRLYIQRDAIYLSPLSPDSLLLFLFMV